MRNRLLPLVLAPVLLVAVLIAAPGAGAENTQVAPDVQKLAVVPSRFVALPLGPEVLPSDPGVSTTGGAKVTFTILDGTFVDFVVKAEKTGRRAGGKCVKGKPRKRTKRRKSNACTLTRLVPGTFKLVGISGANEFNFSGRMGDKSLAPGRYRLVAKAEGKAARSSFARFKIYKPSKKTKKTTTTRTKPKSTKSK